MLLRSRPIVCVSRASFHTCPVVANDHGHRILRRWERPSCFGTFPVFQNLSEMQNTTCPACTFCIILDRIGILFWCAACKLLKETWKILKVSRKENLSRCQFGGLGRPRLKHANENFYLCQQNQSARNRTPSRHTPRLAILNDVERIRLFVSHLILQYNYPSETPCFRI